MFHCFDLCFCRPKNIMVYNCTTGSTNPFHWGEVGMILPVFLNVRINLKELKMLSEFLCQNNPWDRHEGHWITNCLMALNAVLQIKRYSAICPLPFALSSDPYCFSAAICSSPHRHLWHGNSAFVFLSWHAQCWRCLSLGNSTSNYRSWCITGDS